MEVSAGVENPIYEGHFLVVEYIAITFEVTTSIWLIQEILENSY